MQITNSTTQLFETTKDELLSKTKDELLDNSFESLIQEKNENIKLRNNEKEEREALVKDLLSLLKTGFTEGELQQIQELLEKLESLKKKANNGNQTLSQIESTIKDLKTTLIQAQEKVTGRSIKDTNEINNELLPIQQEFEEKINGLKSILSQNMGTTLKESQLLSMNTNDQLKLIEQLKQKK